MMLYHKLFPQFAGDLWAEVNLNSIALKYADEPIQTNESHWVEELHRMLGVNHSWGGWLEHRNFIFRNHYHKDIGEDHFWHLGVDYNVPVYSDVHLPIDAKLIVSEVDSDQDGGWGGKLIFSSPKGLFILGHLDRIVTDLRDYVAGDVVGRVADASVNGNWFPHLHVQCCRILDLKVDGYSHRYEGIEVDFPNPETQLV